MSEFLETYNLPRLSHEETENMYSPFTSKEFESVIEDLTKKSPGPDGLTATMKLQGAYSLEGTL